MSNETKPLSYGGWWITVGLIALATYGLFSGVVFWERVGLGVCWIFATPMLGLLVSGGLLTDTDPMKEIRARLALRPAWRVWSLRLIDIPVLVALAGYGHWITFAGFMAQALLTLVVEQKADEEAKEKCAKTP